MSRIDVYGSVTERIIAELETGVVPWRKPWVGGYPSNIRTGKPYRGINVFILSCSAYSDHRWGTYKAIQESGGQVRKGEHGTWIVLWKTVTKRAKSEGDEDETYRLLRYYKVFNAEQAEGLPALETDFDNAPLERAQAIVDGYDGGPTVFFKGARACYSLMADTVECPPLSKFIDSESFYSTLFHELVHSTGHESRLKRDMSGFFASIPYSKEELVAEMGAAMLCGMAGIDNLDQNAAYVENWLGALRNDKKLVVQAAALAQRAADHILGTTFEDHEEPQPVLAAV